jgi:RimJ/RimL family protein N-acetyltransferase
VQPTLTTPRLVLRPARPADLDALWALWTAPEVRRFLWDDRAVTRAEAADALADCLALGDRGLGLWIVGARAAGAAAGGAPAADAPAPLGCAGLLPVDVAAAYEPRLAGLVEPLVALAPAAWRRGYAGEALAALQAHARGALGLARLAGVTDVPNAASDRMLRRAGFAPLGEADGPRHRLRTYLWDAGAGPAAGGGEAAADGEAAGR